MFNIFHFSVNKLFCTNLKILYLVIFQLSNTELFAILEKHEYSTLRLDSEHLLPSQLYFLCYIVPSSQFFCQIYRLTELSTLARLNHIFLHVSC